MNKVLKIVRGVPGSGKSTLAKALVSCDANAVGPFEADDFMVNAEGGYEFDARRLGECHGKCRAAVEDAMKRGWKTVVQSNTNIRRSEMKPYLDLAARYGYQVQEIIVKADFGSVHGVPAEKLAQMRANFEF